MQNPDGVPLKQSRAKILPPSPENLALASNALKQEAVVGMPTETVYGLAGNVWSVTALSRIFKAKNRPTTDPLIVHVNLRERTLEELEALDLIDLSSIPAFTRVNIQNLISKFWPGPLTLILPKNQKVPDLATSGLSTVALRMPGHPVALELITQAGTPLAAPSANRFGKISPTHAQAVADELGDEIDLILDGGPCLIGLESTVLGLRENGGFELLRPGGTPIEAIEAIIEQTVERPLFSGGGLKTVFASVPQLSPGLLESHYAPSRPLEILPAGVLKLGSEVELSWLKSRVADLPPDSAVGLLAFSGSKEDLESGFSRLTSRRTITRVLSPNGDPAEAAQRLFALMRELDGSEAVLLFVEPTPVLSGLGLAITDRLKRASARRF